MKAVQVYAAIMILFALISCLCAAYYACFGSPSSLGLKILDGGMEVCFGLDIIRNFLMRYEGYSAQPIDFKSFLLFRLIIL